MAERIRTALKCSYAGAILVGWTLAQGVTNLIALVMLPLNNAAVRYYNQRQSGSFQFSETKIFDPIQFGVGAVKVGVVVGVGLILLNWIYPPASTPLEVVDGAKPTE